MKKFILTAASRLGISTNVVSAQEIMWLKFLGVGVGEDFLHGTLNLQVSYVKATNFLAWEHYSSDFH